MDMNLNIVFKHHSPSPRALCLIIHILCFYRPNTSRYVVDSDVYSFDLEPIEIDDNQNHASLDLKAMIKQNPLDLHVLLSCRRLILPCIVRTHRRYPPLVDS